MSLYPLAIYTAEHGLDWTYPKEEISFSELDACRKAFGRLPDFDAGEKGFEGVWATGSRVFAMRCQSVSAWDFRGRAATYLAVTWLPRQEAGNTDFEKLLSAPALREPSHQPSSFFEAEARNPGTVPCAMPGESILPDGFARAGGIIAQASLSTTLLFRRTLGERRVVCSKREPIAPEPIIAETDSGLPAPKPPEIVLPPPPQKPAGLFLPWPLAFAFLALWIATLVFASLTFYQLRQAKKNVLNLQNQAKETKDECCGRVSQREVEPAKNISAKPRSDAEFAGGGSADTNNPPRSPAAKDPATTNRVARQSAAAG